MNQGIEPSPNGLADAIIEAAQSVHAQINQLPFNESQHIRNTVTQCFTEKHTRWLWEHLKDSVAIQDEHAWRWIDEYIGNKKTILFFDDKEMKLAFSFQNGSEIVFVLEHMPSVEFYLTNSNIEYLICFNHHDYLIACGTAKEWLVNKIREIK